MGLCLDIPVQCLSQYTQEGVTPSYPVLHTFLKLPSLAVFYTRLHDHFICLSESHCGTATATDGPEALFSSGRLHLFRCCSLHCTTKKRRVRRTNVLTACVRVNIHRLPIEPPTHYLPSLSICPPSPTHQPNYACIYLPIYLRTHPSLPSTYHYYPNAYSHTLHTAASAIH